MSMHMYTAKIEINPGTEYRLHELALQPTAPYEIPEGGALRDRFLRYYDEVLRKNNSCGATTFQSPIEIISLIMLPADTDLIAWGTTVKEALSQWLQANDPACREFTWNQQHGLTICEDVFQAEQQMAMKTRTCHPLKQRKAKRLPFGLPPRSVH
jgi:hypothetical protein